MWAYISKRYEMDFNLTIKQSEEKIVVRISGESKEQRNDIQIQNFFNSVRQAESDKNKLHALKKELLIAVIIQFNIQTGRDLEIDLKKAKEILAGSDEIQLEHLRQWLSNDATSDDKNELNIDLTKLNPKAKLRSIIIMNILVDLRKELSFPEIQQLIVNFHDEPEIIFCVFQLLELKLSNKNAVSQFLLDNLEHFTNSQAQSKFILVQFIQQHKLFTEQQKQFVKDKYLDNFIKKDQVIASNEFEQYELKVPSFRRRPSAAIYSWRAEEINQEFEQVQQYLQANNIFQTGFIFEDEDEFQDEDNVENATIKKLKGEISEKDEKIEVLTKDYEGLILEFNHQVDEKDKTIKDLNWKLQQLQKEREFYVNMNRNTPQFSSLLQTTTIASHRPPARVQPQVQPQSTPSDQIQAEPQHQQRITPVTVNESNQQVNSSYAENTSNLHQTRQRGASSTKTQRDRGPITTPPIEQPRKPLILAPSVQPVPKSTQPPRQPPQAFPPPPNEVNSLKEVEKSSPPAKEAHESEGVLQPTPEDLKIAQVPQDAPIKTEAEPQTQLLLPIIEHKPPPSAQPEGAPPPPPGGAPPPPPPPPPGGAPPPPPPPGGAPPPPPPSGGAPPQPVAQKPKGPEGIVPSAKPKRTVKQITWSKLAKIENSIFEKIPNLKLTVNYDRLEELFEDKRRQSVIITQARPADARPVLITKLEGKRLQEVSFALAKLYCMKKTKDDMINALKTCNLALWEEQDLVELVMRCAPKPDELSQWEDAGEDLEKYQDADKFCIQLSRIDCYMERLISLQQNFEAVKHQQQIVDKIVLYKDGFDYILNDQSIKLALGVVLHLGNFLNGKSFRGEAYGITLQSFAELDQKSTVDSKIDFMMIVAETLEANGYPVNLDEDLSRLEELSQEKNRLDNLKGFLDAYVKVFPFIQKAAESKKQSEDDEAQTIFKELHQHFHEFIIVQEIQINLLLERYAKICEYFCEGKNKPASDELIKKLYEFKKSLKSAYLRLKEYRKKQQMQALKKQQTI